MTTRRKFQWARMSWKEIEMASQENPQPVVFFPNRRHRVARAADPVGTDIVQAQHCCDQVAEATGGLSLPGIPFGYSPQFNAFHGTITLSPATVTAIVSKLSDAAVYNIAQLAIGLNPAVLILTGVWAQDHGAFGTVHIGIGTSANLGGVTKAAAHFDGMMNRPTLRLDGQVVLENGHLNISLT